MRHIPAVSLTKDLADQCDRIAYQFTGRVQSQAALIVIDRERRVVVQASESSGSVLGVEASELVGQPLHALDELLGGGVAEDLVSSAAEAAPAYGPRIETGDGPAVWTRTHRLGPDVLIEFDPESNDGAFDEGALSRLLPELVLKLSDARTIGEACMSAAELTQVALGYDRCMVYRFDGDWNREVLGESHSEREPESYLGLRFPAREIPASIREMYKRCPIRMCVDHAAEGSPLVPVMAEGRDEHTDLTHVMSRTSAGVCRTYYENMGVRATLTLPVMIRGEVCGHLSYHHRDPRRPSPVHDTLLRSISKSFGDAISRIESSQREQAERFAHEIQEAMASKAGSCEDETRRMQLYLPRLRELLGCDAISLTLGAEVYTDGEGLTPDIASRIIKSLAVGPKRQLAVSARLVVDHPELRGRVGGFAGALAVQIGHGSRECLLVVRREKREETRWAGNPSEGAKWEEDGRPKLTPRSSFSEYRATTAESSREWSHRDRVLAQSCARHIGMRFLQHQATMSARAQTAFLANVSHEIRTPMTAIVGFADLLANDEEVGGDHESMMNAVRSIRGNADHLLAIINDILDICKVDAGKLSVEQVETDPIRLARECLDLVRPKATEKELKLSLTCENAIPSSIRSDPTRLRQIMLNLLSNAIKFTHEGRVTLSLACDSKAELLRFRVIDSGVGLSREQLERVLRFEPFRQADVSTTRKFGGTGLGLSISNSLARLLGGWIHAESEPDRGSTFTFVLDVAGSIEMR
ncbi:MAG: ATP-binding protein [Planctomycetota bacterium]